MQIDTEEVDISKPVVRLTALRSPMDPRARANHLGWRPKDLEALASLKYLRRL